MEFLKVFLIVVACQAPNFITCKWMESLDRTEAGPVQCQLDRIPASAWWTDEIRRQGFSNWEIFTRCELVNPEKNGGRG